MFLYFLSSACDVRYDFCIKAMFGSSLHLVVCKMSYLRDFCLLAYSGVQCIVLCFCFVCPMLPVSLDCPFLIAPWEFSNVYLQGIIVLPVS